METKMADDPGIGNAKEQAGACADKHGGGGNRGRMPGGKM